MILLVLTIPFLYLVVAYIWGAKRYYKLFVGAVSFASKEDIEWFDMNQYYRKMGHEPTCGMAQSPEGVLIDVFFSCLIRFVFWSPLLFAIPFFELIKHPIADAIVWLATPVGSKKTREIEELKQRVQVVETKLDNLARWQPNTNDNLGY